jgi:hypothetical protein
MQALILRAYVAPLNPELLIIWIASIKNKNRETVLEIIPAQDTELRALIRKYQAKASVSKDDVASGKHNSFPSNVN